MRTCDVCGQEMTEGFVVESITHEYYCSKKCRSEKMSDDSYEELYDEGVAYWTEFEDDMED
jgi:hypothetical protein